MGKSMLVGPEATENELQVEIEHGLPHLGIVRLRAQGRVMRLPARVDHLMYPVAADPECIEFLCQLFGNCRLSGGGMACNQHQERVTYFIRTYR